MMAPWITISGSWPRWCAFRVPMVGIFKTAERSLAAHASATVPNCPQFSFTMAEKPLVLVTGVSGFVGSHVAHQLVLEGYSVRGTVRGAKLDLLRTALGANYPALELVKVDDIVTEDLAVALKDVKVVVHVASPLVGRVPPGESLDCAINGTLNVLQQASQAGITKVVLTSSWAATLDREHASLKQTYEGVTFTERDWGNTSREEVLREEHTPLWVYVSGKILAEKAAWKFAEEHPNMDLATINPPFIYGPLVPHFPIPAPTVLGTNRMIYVLLSGNVPPQFAPFFCDVRDVARAHVAALDVSRQTPAQNKRFLVSGGSFSWKQATEHLLQTRPDLKERLPSLNEFSPLPGTPSSIDVSRAKEILRVDGYIDWRQTIGDVVDMLLAAEQVWNGSPT